MTHHRLDVNRLSRRQVLKMAVTGTLGIAAGQLWPAFDLSAASQNGAVSGSGEFSPDLDIHLAARPTEISLFAGAPTRTWQFQASVLKGGRDRVTEIPRSYLGPIIRANRGEKVRIRFSNAIPEKSIIHWHGLHVPAIMDGHPRDVVAPGETYLYEFEVKNRAGTYWYHPHPHGSTGPQVYRGLAGLFLVSDQEELALGLPSGPNDIPLVIQDRTFDRDNQLVYTSGHMMEQMIGFLGDQVLVNGRPDFTLPVSTKAYRLRLLNGSNSRIYRLAWEDGRPMTIIGTDGGLLEKPHQRRYLYLAPGERTELWTDFSDDAVGSQTALMSLPFDIANSGRGMMMGRGMTRRGALPNGAGFTIFQIKVVKCEKDDKVLPQQLSGIDPLRYDGVDNLSNPRKFFLTANHMQWSINGRTFEMENVAADEIVRLGAREIWEFHNNAGGMMPMMNMPHPIHLHGKQFRVLERGGLTHDGYVDEGWKDTVLLMPGEWVRIMVDFDEYPGLFLYHCHNLEHEDMGMMRNYYVRS